MTTFDDVQGGGKALGSILILALLVAAPAIAAAYPVTILYGRSWPLSIVIDANRGLAYVDGMSGIYPPTGFSFGVINVTSHELVKVLPLDDVPGALALDQASGNVYVAGGDSVQVFEAGSQSMGQRIGIGHPIRSLAFDGRVSKDIFVTAENKVYTVDPGSGRIDRNATVGNGANGMALDPATGRLFVAEYPDSEIFVFQAQSLSPIGTIKLPVCCAAQMAIDPVTHLLFATTGTRYLEVVNAQLSKLVKSQSVAPSDQNSTNVVAIDGQTGRAFVSSSPGGSIIEIDISGNVLATSFKVSSQVAALAVNSKTHELYAANYHQVTVFDISGVDIVTFLLVLGAVAAVVMVAAVLLVLRLNPASRAQR